MTSQYQELIQINRGSLQDVERENRRGQPIASWEQIGDTHLYQKGIQSLPEYVSHAHYENDL